MLQAEQDKIIGQFWGTSAAEGVPAPFCRCATCMEAREKGGIYRRLRSCFRLSEHIMIDLGADSVCQSIQFGDLTDLRHVLITHTHDDHLNPHMMMEAMWSRDYRSETLHYYFTDKAYEIVEHWRNSPWILKGKIPGWERDGVVAFHKLEYGVPMVIDGIEVTPFRGNHLGNVKENSALYLLKLPDGRKLFYGLDSAVYFPETVEALKAHQIDIFVSEATGGIHEAPPSWAHMSLSQVRELIGTLCEQGTLSKDSLVYLSHINHRTSYGQMIEAVERLQFPIKTVVAVDGMKIL